jgi:hypothetical protein
VDDHQEWEAGKSNQDKGESQRLGHSLDIQKQFKCQEQGGSARGEQPLPGLLSRAVRAPPKLPSLDNLPDRWGAIVTPHDSLPTLLGQFESGAFSKLLHAKVGPSG